MCAELQLCQITGRTIFHFYNAKNFALWVTRPMNHTVFKGNRYIYPFIAHYVVLSFLAAFAQDS